MTASKVEPFPVTFVESVEEAQGLLTWLGERRPGPIAVDTETEGLKLFSGDKVRLIQIGDSKRAYVLSAKRWYGVAEEVLRKYDGNVCFANAPFDLHALELAGLPIPETHRIQDIILMDHLLFPPRAHGLKKIADRLWLGASVGEYELDQAMRNNKWDWRTVPENCLQYWVYAGSDVVFTSRIYEKLLPEISVRGLQPQYEVELAVQAITYKMEKRGLRVDPVYTSELLQQWTIEQDTLLKELNDIGLRNPSSGLQVAQAMQITEKWDPTEWTETGLPKTDESVLKGIDSEISRRVLRYRRLRKWSKVYLSAFLNERDSEDRVHPNIRSLRARTGRMSITDPPLQTLPSRDPTIRTGILSYEDQVLWTIDYDSQEARMYAHYSQDNALIQTFLEGGKIHRLIASRLYGISKEEVTPEQYANAKIAIYSKIYGAGDAKLADSCGVVTEQVREAFADGKAFSEEIDRIGKLRLAETGKAYIMTYGGRYIPADDDKIYTLANYLIQGGASDVLKKAMLKLSSAGFDDNMMLPVHDELLFSFPLGEEDGPREAAKLMENKDFSVPLTVEISGPYSHWGEKYHG